VKFPEVSNLGRVAIEGAGTFTVWMVNDEWEPDDPDHESDHARGGCECHCPDPVTALEAAAAMERAVGE
jgi:hypothetical protein